MNTSHQVTDRERFNHWSDTYEHSFMQWFLFDRVHKGVLRRIPVGFNPSLVLDIGCGTGRLLRRIHVRWPEAVLVGIDPSEGMLAKAHLLTPSADFYQASAEKLPLESNSMDLVSSTMSIHHWSNQSQGFIETSRVLRPGGFFILVDVNIGHGHPLSRSHVRELYNASGFSIRSQASPVPFITFTVGIKQ